MNFFKACLVLEIDSLQIYKICSDRKSLKRQYTKLALKYHPDKTQGDTTSKFQEIHEAYQYLNRLTVHGIKQEMNSNQADYNDYTHYEEDEDFHESDVPPSYMTLFKCFMGTELDLLSVGNFILHKNKQDAALIRSYKDLYELD